MAKPLKFYTPGPQHFVTTDVARALDLPRGRQQADVYVAAYTKAEAFRYLAEVGLAPSTVSNADFRIATGNTVDALVAADALSTAGAIVATKPHGTNSFAVWVSNDGHGIVPFGKFVRGKFIPDPDLVAGGGLKGNLDTAAVAVPDDASALTEPAEAPRSEPPAAVLVSADAPASEEVEMVKSMLFSSGGQIRDLEDELKRKRQARGELVLRALSLGIPVEDIAAEMGVGPSRVYQMKDKALADMADLGDFRPGVKVSVETAGHPAGKAPIAEVIPMPDDAQAPNSRGDWVWVRYDSNHAVVPIRPWRLRRAVPSCSICPPAEAPYGLTPAQLSVHQVAQHGGRR